MTWASLSPYALQSGDYIIGKYIVAGRAIYTLWHGATRIGNFTAAVDAKTAAANHAARATTAP